MIHLQEHDLEYAISLYIDGSIGPLERAALDERFASDANARAILAEYVTLNEALKRDLPMPAIDWDQLSATIRTLVASEEAPVRHYSMGRIGWPGRLAIAAAVLFAVSIASFFVNQSGVDVSQPSNSAIVAVSGPAVEESKTPVVSNITIGPSPAVASGNWRAAEEVVTRPTVVHIDQTRSNAPDSDPSMY